MIGLVWLVGRWAGKPSVGAAKRARWGAALFPCGKAGNGCGVALNRHRHLHEWVAVSAGKLTDLARGRGQFFEHVIHGVVFRFPGDGFTQPGRRVSENRIL